MYYHKVSMMINFCKEVYHSMIRAGYQVVHHQKRSFLSVKRAQLRQSIVKFNSEVVIKYFFLFAGTKQDSFGWWANHFIKLLNYLNYEVTGSGSVLDKFKREYRLAATGRTGENTSERMCQSAIHDSNDESFQCTLLFIHKVSKFKSIFTTVERSNQYLQNLQHIQCLI